MPGVGAGAFDAVIAVVSDPIIPDGLLGGLDRSCLKTERVLQHLPEYPRPFDQVAAENDTARLAIHRQHPAGMRVGREPVAIRLAEPGESPVLVAEPDVGPEGLRPA